MNKLITASLALAVISAGAYAQVSGKITLRPYNWHPAGVQAQSTDVSVGADGIKVLWLQDGLSNNFTAFAYPLYKVTGLGSRVNIVGLGAYQMNNTTKTNFYTGTGVSVDVLNSGGFTLTGSAGWKGFDLTQNFSAAQGKGAWVLGLGVNVPIK